MGHQLNKCGCGVQLELEEQKDGVCSYCIKADVELEDWIKEVKVRKEHDADKKLINDEFDQYLQDTHPEYFIGRFK